MRFVAGTFTTQNTDGDLAGWQPRQAQIAYDEQAARVWTVGYAADEIRTCAAPEEQTAVLAIGCCLATDDELSAARGAAEYGRWSTATRLSGSYLSVVRTRQMLRVAGTRAGTVSVYWLPLQDGVLWATAATPLAARIQSEPDPAVLLAEFALRGVDAFCGDSHFGTVRRVPPGHALVLEAGRAPRTEPVPDPHQELSFAVGARAVREAVASAVTGRAARLGRLSADLSGGVDSSTVTSLAAACGPLLAVTYTDARMGEQDDVLYAKRTAQHLPAVHHSCVDGTRHGVQHFDGLEDPSVLPVTDTPSLTVGLLAIKSAQLAPATGYGSRGHLTGRGGDDVLGAVTTMAIDQYRVGYRLDALRGIAAYARDQHAATWPVLRQAARTSRAGYPRALTLLADLLGGPAVLRHPGWAPPAETLSWCGITAGATWLTRTGRAAVAELVAARAAAADPYVTPGALHERLALEHMGDGHATFDQTARQQWGLPVHAPFLDTPVVDASHAIPGYARIQPGDYKPLARAAFTGAVPGFLLQRRTKTAFTSSVYAGLRANAPTLRRILDGSAFAQAGLVDVLKARAALEAAARGERAPLAALHTLIVTELWLASLSLAREAWWEKTGAKEMAR